MAKKTKAAGLSIEEKLEQALIVPGYEPYQIPENWCWVSLTNGFARCLDSFRKPVNAKSRETMIGSIPYYGATGQVGWINNYLTNEHLVLLGEDGAPFLDPKKNKAYIIKGKAWVNNHAHILQSFYGVEGNIYLMHYLNIFNYRGFVNGTTRLKLTQEKMNTIPIPLPPLSEQHRIVERIEFLFSKLDEAKEKAQAVIDSFETRKAAILHKAFSGELTAKWREENGVGIESWEKCSLIDILIEKPRNGYSPKPVDYPTNVKSMTLSATTSGVFMPQYFKYIDEQISADSYLWLKKGDILIQRANSLDKVGTSAIYTGEDNEFIYPDLIMKLRVINKVSSHFIAYQLKTQKSIQYFRSNATGTAGNMPKINQKVVSATPIMLPTHAEQIELVRILDDLFSKETKEERNAKKVTDQIEKMKKAILSRAFRGELGTNAPSEESAVELLKQILSGNTNEESEPKPKRKRVVIPQEVAALLKTELEKKIMRLFYKSENGEVSAEEIMAVSSNKVELIEAVSSLKEKKLIKQLNNNSFVL